CHAGAPGASKAQQVSIAGCTTCHDTTSFEATPPEGMVAHTAGARGDAECDACHAPGAAFDPAIAHLSVGDYVSWAGLAKGLSVGIDAVTGVAPGAQPTVRFHLSDPDGAVELSALSRLRASMSGPDGAPTWSISGVDLTK